MKRKKLSIVIPVLLIYFIGVSILLYPIISNIWAKQHQLKAIENYSNTIVKTDRSEIEEELANANRYNTSLRDNRVVLTDPFDPNAPDFPDGNYDDLLNLSDEMAYIEIPKINVNLPIYHGTEKDTLAKGVGHLMGTSLPVGGIGTHAVLSAHSGLPTAELFTNLNKLKEGDCFYVHALDITLAYRVESMTVVEPDDVDSLYIVNDRDLCTLFTCTPYGVNTHRLLVRGTRIDYIEAEKEPNVIEKFITVGLSAVEIVQLIAVVLSVVLFGVIIVMLIKPRKNNKTEENKKKKN